MIRLILEPAPKPGNFIARLEDGTFVCQSDQPLADGARQLLKMGFDPSQPITARHQGKAFDSFTAQTLGAWAKVTYSESDRGGLRREKWHPRPEGLRG